MITFKRFEDLKEHTKLIDKIQSDGKRNNGQIIEIYHSDDQIYLASDKSIWPSYQFNPEDYEIYTGNKLIGEYI